MKTILSPTADPKESLRNIAFDLPGRFPIARWAPIPLRLIVGFGFMQHGFAKVGRGPDAFATILHALGVPAPHFMASVTIRSEEHTSELQSHSDLVCRLLLEKKKTIDN